MVYKSIQSIGKSKLITERNVNDMSRNIISMTYHRI